MRPHRTAGNRVLTRWVRWTDPPPRPHRRAERLPGVLAAAAAAAAEVVHDYNYAQVLTLDLLGKGFAYAEVPITYAFRTTGTSFVRLGTYLRNVHPGRPQGS